MPATGPTALTPLPPLNPMSTFDPDRRVLVYDELNDRFIAWEPKWADSYRRDGALDADGKSGWDGLLLTGWINHDAIQSHGPAIIPRWDWEYTEK